jgi:hypothetical protein
MLSGVCIAGYLNESHPASHLRWIRPVKPFGTLLLGDITDADWRVLRCWDVAALSLCEPRPDPPHCEDWEAELVRRRPRVVRRLEGDRRAAFLADHVDKAPEDVLIKETRSLCLVRPRCVWAHSTLDGYSERYRNRLGFDLPGVHHPRANSAEGLPVTDIKWRALGRHWLGDGGGEVSLSHDELCGRLEIDEIYLALGLSRPYRGRRWLLVIGVHTVPDYCASIDYSRL